MANVLYTLGRQKFLDGSVAWSSDNIKLCLVTSSYTPAPTTDQWLSDIPGGAIVFTSSNFASKTSTGGIANAANITLSSVSGSACAYIVIYKDTGVAGTSALLVLIDTATGLPVTPNGGNITISWDTGANKIFAL